MSRCNVKIRGIAISSGFGVGKACIAKGGIQLPLNDRAITASQVNEEHTRIRKAFASVIRDLSDSAGYVSSMIDDSFAEIFTAQIEMLKDPVLLAETRRLLENELISAERTVMKVFSMFMEKMKQTDNSAFKDNLDDLADLSKRVVNKLSNKSIRRFSHIPPESVLITDHLLPSDAIGLPHENIKGIVLEAGGAASHAAILTREMGIPAVSEITEIGMLANKADTVLVDGNDGIVIINPDDSCISSYQEQQLLFNVKRNKAALRAKETAVTFDGKKIPVFANIGDKNDAQHAVENGADGIGLFRIEQIYLSLENLPDSEYLKNEIMKIIEPVKNMRVNIRLLDTGDDKQLPFLSYPEESNPALGLRGIRFLLKYRDLLQEQLKALLSIAKTHDISILVPMVTSVEDIIGLKNELFQCAQHCSSGHIPPIGAMIETPAAALLAAEIAREVDFLSIGTNDLTQYTMASGRENHLVAKYYKDAHPAVMKLIDILIDSISEKHIAVCGELASQVESVPLLLKAGIDALSVNPLQIPIIKEAVRSVSLSSYK